MQYMQEGKNFCLKLNFGANIKQWFSENVDREEACCLSSRSNTGYGCMTISVTNCSTPSTDFCGTMLCLCYLVCPLSLLIGVPCCLAHKLYRKVKCIDKKQDFRNLPITFRRTLTVSNYIRCALPNPSAPQRRTQPMSAHRQGHYRQGHPRQGQPSRKHSELLSNDELDQTL
ncbi:uncharacterized protein [Argopecten irradians]|uniref:uncharacterized protein isoform X2 n=1 Tax=Argopecten irradians TaxID=31199 RepID=UPI00372429FE